MLINKINEENLFLLYDKNWFNLEILSGILSRFGYLLDIMFDSLRDGKKITEALKEENCNQKKK